MASHFRGDFFEEYSLLPSESQGALTALFYLLTRLGHEAVLIFFVLSGYLVGGKALERIQQRAFNLTDYSIDRTVRIMLPLLSALLLYIPVTYMVGGAPNWSSWLGNLLSLQGVVCGPIIGPLWSLSYEVWFYIMMGATAVALSDSRWRAMGGVTLFVVALVFVRLTPTYLFIWLMGAFAYKLMPNELNRPTLLITGLLSIATIGILQLSREGHTSFGLLAGIDRSIAELSFAFCFCLFLQQLVLCRPTSSFALTVNRIGTRLAAFSYTMYLVHPLVQRVLVYLGAPKSPTVSFHSVMLYLAWLAVGLIASYLVYLLFERNTAVCKEAIKRRLAMRVVYR